MIAAEIDETFLTVHPTLYDAIYVVGGEADNQKKFTMDVVDFINEAYKHYKAIGIASTGKVFFEQSNGEVGPGIITNENTISFADDFINAVAEHRHWDRKVYGWE